MEPQDDNTGSDFRELFSDDETRAFFRPVFQLPTRPIAFGSIGLSLLLAGALIFSPGNRKNRPGLRQKPGLHSPEKRFLRPAKRAKTDTTLYLRRQTP
ncbi:hypothetical protein GCM10027299_12180 [Larkinella ripae]